MLLLQENLIVEEPERHDVAIETTHTLERLSNQEVGKKRHDLHKPNISDSKEKQTQREDTGIRTPEEGICLEFEEFNPEVVEKQHREERLTEKSSKKEFKKFREKTNSNDFNHKFKKDIINHVENNFELNNVGKTFDVNQVTTENLSVENPEIIYSKPDKKKKTKNLEISKSNEKNINSSGHRVNQETRIQNNTSQKVTSHTEQIDNKVSSNNSQFEPIIENRINLADKIGLFENNQVSNYKEKSKNLVGNNNKSIKGEFKFMIL